MYSGFKDAFLVLKATLAFLVYFQSRLKPVLLAPCAVLLAIKFASAFELINVWVSTPMYFAVAILMALNIHRVLILGADAIPPNGMKIYGKLQLRFYGYELVMFFILLGATFFAVNIAMLLVGDPEAFIDFPFLMWVCQALGYYVAARFTLVLPAAACDKPITLQQSWQLTAPHKIVIVLMMVVLPLSIRMLTSLLESMPALEWISHITFPFIVIYTIAIVSVMYKRMVEE